MKKKAFIPISALVGALLLAIIATMTPFIAERNLAYAQTNSDIATLSRLTVSTGALSPAFDPADLPSDGGNDGTSVESAHPYTVNVRHSVSSLTVSATKTDRNASVAYIVNGGTPGNSGRISLAIGNANVVVVSVTAEDATNQKFYEVTVTRASSTASDDATLSALSVSPGTLSPAFMAATTEYSVDLPYDPNTNADVDLTVTASESASVVTVKMDGDVVALQDIPIDEGDNTITVDVLAPDFVATETYTLTINRARRNASDDATLSSLDLNQGMLMPAFDAANLPPGDGESSGNAHAYTVSVPHSVFEVTVTAATTDSRAKWEVTSPEDGDSTQRGHQVGVTATTTEINIMATAEDRTTPKFYQVTVTRAAVGASTNATLSTLTVTPGMTTSPTTLGTKFDYSVELTNASANVNLAVTASATGAVVTVKKGDEAIASGDLGTIAIDEGDNTITVDVLAPDFVATKTYTLTINRASGNASDDDRLSSLKLSEGMLMPAFDPAALSVPDGGTAGTPHVYTARVPNGVESLTVTAQAASSVAMVNIASASDSSVSEGAVDLIVGGNVITIMVTAEDRGDAKVYQVTVTRASSTASNDATLSTLTVNPGMTTSPTTLSTKFDYSVELTNVQSEVDLTVAAAQAANGAVVTVKKDGEVISGTDLDNISIDEGDNTITVDVLAPDFVATKTYTLTINRASGNASDDDTLSSLRLSEGMLMPAFDPADLPGDAAGPHEYTARVPNSVGSLTVTAEAASSVAMVNIASAQDSSVSEGAVDLFVGDNVITIMVTAQDRGVARVYQVTVTRVAASASSNAALSGLTLETEAENDVDPSLTPAFEAASLPALTDGAHHFTASVSRGTGVIRVVPVAADDANAVINVMSNADDTVEALADGDEGQYEVDLEVGDNVITVMVTAANVVTTKTYKITINRPGMSNAALSDLSLSDVPLNEAFGTAANDAYTAGVANSVDITTVTATAVQSNATVSIMPVDADSAMDGHQVALTSGENTITVTVTAGDNTRVYTVTVTVAPPVEGDLLDRYDADDSGDIDLTEVSAAIDDYFNDDLTLDEVSAVIDLYFGVEKKDHKE